MDIIKNMAKELTGNLDRACILLHGSSKPPKGVKSGNFIPIKVQYNPGAIVLSGERDISRTKEPNVTAECSEKYKQDSIYPVDMILRTELIFDDTDLADAFFKTDSGKFSETGLIKTGISEAVNAAGKEHSVQEIAELFVAAACSAYTRTVCFSWGKQMFWGELIKVDVEYMMFNKKGNPIRAKVTIEIRQDTIEQQEAAGNTVNSEKRYATERQWNKKFDAMFGESGRLATNKRFSSTGNSRASNLFNFY